MTEYIEKVNRCKIIEGRHICTNPEGFVEDCLYGERDSSAYPYPTCLYYHQGNAGCLSYNVSDKAKPTKEEKLAANEKVYQAARDAISEWPKWKKEYAGIKVDK